MACSVLEKYPLLFEGKESDFDAICNTLLRFWPNLRRSERWASTLQMRSRTRDVERGRSRFKTSWHGSLDHAIGPTACFIVSHCLMTTSFCNKPTGSCNENGACGAWSFRRCLIVARKMGIGCLGKEVKTPCKFCRFGIICGCTMILAGDSKEGRGEEDPYNRHQSTLYKDLQRLAVEKCGKKCGLKSTSIEIAWGFLLFEDEEMLMGGENRSQAESQFQSLS